ncbi:family 31 glycosyl hydrolase [Xylariaceae sp. FL0804]|nr:family 31 glycosyl hydrolase [Xylariaceae sp. FL0804]
MPGALYNMMVRVLTQALLVAYAAGQSTISSSGSSSSSSSAITLTGTAVEPYGTLPADVDDGQPIIPNILDPEAVDAQTVCPGYKASNVTHDDFGLSATLTLAGAACNIYGDDVESLQLRVEYQSADRLHVEIAPTYIGPENATWFEPPAGILGAAPGPDAPLTGTDLEFAWGNEPSFWMRVVRRSNGEALFDTSGAALVFENQFVELATALPEEYSLYGLGETMRALRLGNNLTRTLWALDNADTIDQNLYGSHPVYYDTRYYETPAAAENGTGGSAAAPRYVPWSQAASSAGGGGGNYSSLTHAVYYRNAHAHEVLLRPSGLTWRTLGGNVDLYFYAGPTVERAARSYQQSTVGLPAMQQYWTFGYHQCRWGYNNWSEVAAMVDSFEQFEIPLETVWNDIDYMDKFRDFTSDPERYPVDEGLEFLEKLHQSGRHYVHIAIYIPDPTNATDAYDTYTRGHEANAFLLNPDGSEYTGAVWPGYTVFPDWLAAGTGDWWTRELQISHRNVTFDGIWIDMSEVSSFCVGSCGSGNLTNNPAPGGIGDAPPTEWPEGFNATNATEAASASAVVAASEATADATSTSTTTTSYLRTTPTPGARNVNWPPYAINNAYSDLAVHAASPNATHQDAAGTQEYDVHNLYGFGIVNATYNALKSVFPGKRPFIIGRSNFAGFGTVAGHWGGDNYSYWLYMYLSIPQALSFSLFGVPMFGADTCGFNGNTDEELCARWMQLSAFFPFYRNHNTIHALAQEPYRWASVAAASRAAMDVRYALLPYLYTLFRAAHADGATVMRALAWEFPDDPRLAAADRQFLLGPSLLVTPVLTPNAVDVAGVFPGTAGSTAGTGAGTGTRWYDWYNQSAITDPAALAGANVTLPAPLGHIPVFVRGGSVLPLQPRRGALTVAGARQQPWALLAALDGQGAARGRLYLDDGESVAPNATREVDLAVSTGRLRANGTGAYRDGLPLADVTVMGVASRPGVVAVDGRAVASFAYDEAGALLRVTGLENLTAHGVWSRDWEMTWS